MQTGLEIGAVIAGRFRLERFLGAGSLAEVFLASDGERRVALKVFLPKVVPAYVTAAKIEAVLREKGAHHPAIIAPLNVGEDAGHKYVVQPFVDGCSLRNWLDHLQDDDRVADSSSTALMLDRLAAILSDLPPFAVHGALKPSNILLEGMSPDDTLGADTRVFLTDFGTCHVLSFSKYASLQLSAGSPYYYLAPEFISFGGKVDARADQYSLGVLAYEMLTGHVPRKGFKPIRDLNQQAPEEWDDLIARLLSRQPDGRFGSFADLRQAVVDVAGVQPPLPVYPAMAMHATPTHAAAPVAPAKAGSFDAMLDGAISSSERFTREEPAPEVIVETKPVVREPIAVVPEPPPAAAEWLPDLDHLEKTATEAPAPPAVEVDEVLKAAPAAEEELLEAKAVAETHAAPPPAEEVALEAEELIGAPPPEPEPKPELETEPEPELEPVPEPEPELTSEPEPEPEPEAPLAPAPEPAPVLEAEVVAEPPVAEMAIEEPAAVAIEEPLPAEPIVEPPSASEPPPLPPPAHDEVGAVIEKIIEAEKQAPPPEKTIAPKRAPKEKMPARPKEGKGGAGWAVAAAIVVAVGLLGFLAWNQGWVDFSSLFGGAEPTPVAISTPVPTPVVTPEPSPTPEATPDDEKTKKVAALVEQAKVYLKQKSYVRPRKACVTTVLREIVELDQNNLFVSEATKSMLDDLRSTVQKANQEQQWDAAFFAARDGVYIDPNNVEFQKLFEDAKKNRTLATLVGKLQGYMAQERYVAPPDACAFYVVRQIEAVQPNHPDAQKARQTMIQRLLTQAQQAYNQQKWDQAISLAEGGLGVSPNHPQFLSILNKAKQAKATTPTPPPATPTPEATPAVALQCPAGMRYIPAGSLRMGSAPDDPLRKPGEKPNTPTFVAAFCIDLYEYPNQPGSQPRVNVNYFSAQKMCADQGKRLCSEREWERTCKGPGNRRFPYGDDYNANACATQDQGGAPRGISSSGGWSGCRSSFGVYDLSGNVREWTSTPIAPGQASYVVRGGSASQPDWAVRCAVREAALPSTQSHTLGFRCCRDPLE